MPLIYAVCLLGVWLVASAAAQSGTPASGEESSSRTQPNQPPTPPDAPAPDLGQQTSPPTESKVKRAVNKFDPHCIDVIFHACWSSPAPPPKGKALTEEEQQAQLVAKDIDVGYFYLNEKNYAAAEGRLKEAAELKPDSTAALIGLAQAQQKLGKRADARNSYEAYLKVKPDGPEADKVKKALAELK
jgi:tetratricopeptide (TPR) repeat protein